MKSKQIAAVLRKRWSANQQAEAIAQLISNRITGGIFPNLVQDGEEFIDFRGLTYDVNDGSKWLELKNIDFSYCVTTGGTRYAVWSIMYASNCRFCYSKMGLVNVYALARNCDFTNADLSGLRIESHNAKILRCNFTGTNMRRAKITSGPAGRNELTNCKFTNADLRDIEFGGCRFIGCDFSGVKLGGGKLFGSFLGGSLFENCTFANTSFKEARMPYCEIIGDQPPEYDPDDSSYPKII